MDTDKPVSQQQDIQIYGHYAWQRYGGSGFYAGGSAAVMNTVPILDKTTLTEADNNDDDLHLRSTKTIIGYHIHASDGDIGHISDFIFDDANWQIIYLVVDTHNWLGGKKVLIKTGTVKEIQWDNSKVIVNLSTEELNDCPVFDESHFKSSRSASNALEIIL